MLSIMKFFTNWKVGMRLISILPYQLLSEALVAVCYEGRARCCTHSLKAVHFERDPLAKARIAHER